MNALGEALDISAEERNQIWDQIWESNLSHYQSACNGRTFPGLEDGKRKITHKRILNAKLSYI